MIRLYKHLCILYLRLTAHIGASVTAFAGAYPTPLSVSAARWSSHDSSAETHPLRLRNQRRKYTPIIIPALASVPES